MERFIQLPNGKTLDQVYLELQEIKTYLLQDASKSNEEAEEIFAKDMEFVGITKELFHWSISNAHLKFVAPTPSEQEQAEFAKLGLELVSAPLKIPMAAFSYGAHLDPGTYQGTQNEFMTPHGRTGRPLEDYLPLSIEMLRILQVLGYTLNLKSVPKGKVDLKLT
jgi:hypothetical protein